MRIIKRRRTRAQVKADEEARLARWAAKQAGWVRQRAERAEAKEARLRSIADNKAARAARGPKAVAKYQRHVEHARLKAREKAAAKAAAKAEAAAAYDRLMAARATVRR